MERTRLSLLVGCILLAVSVAPSSGQEAGPYPPEKTGGSLYADYSPDITNDKQFVAQLITPTPPPGKGGYNPSAGPSYANLLNSKAFSALQGMEVSVAYFSLGPCALVPQHYHPRAAEAATVVSGTVLFVFVDTENKAHYMLVPSGSTVLLPPALPHIYQEYANAPATIISAFSEEDPGLVFLNEATFQFPEGIVRASLGLPNPAATASLNASVPQGFVVVAQDACASTGAGHLG